MQIYKHSTTKLRRGTEFLWVPLDDLACKCPRIRVKHTYLILGNDERETQPTGLIADRRSIAIDWKEEWADRMRRFQRRQFKGKCKTDDNV
ncbi:unnamed protein product [Medioppia subpectinata]|uniref:NTR domain-containing protein n=1 Tax=Medioppia subpectinata TaxID=1979941 RepID=A0A7R9KY95_9ACAR|nr:unnamed protein product [Medioppia subpectinata]CAG2111755.1 unnamed protein product [Medioppia subpectinata]